MLSLNAIIQHQYEYMQMIYEVTWDFDLPYFGFFHEGFSIHNDDWLNQYLDFTT